MYGVNHGRQNVKRGIMKPNFVFIHADQFRADCIGVERKRSVFTPNIDFLANSGTRFDSAYATTPVCIPQRITALTGKLASNHGVLNNVGIPDFPMDGSLISKLNQNDYCTALVGRGFHTYPVQNNLGFEYWFLH